MTKQLLRLLSNRSIPLIVIAMILMNWAKPAANNGWVRQLGADKAKGVIVFVHGVLGDAQKTWSNGNTYWPELLTRDKTFDGQDIYVYEYPSPKLGKSYSIDELAENLRLMLDSDSVSRYKEIIFVSHSMGGLVTRAFLLKYQSRIMLRVRFLYFFATPTTGSPYAALAGIASNNPQFGQMYPMNSDSYLADLQRNWLAAHLNLKSYCAYEKLPIFGQIIVDQQSASNLCTEPLDPINANHIDIVKPIDVKSTSYRAFKSAFEQTMSTQEGEPLFQKNGKNPSIMHPAKAVVPKKELDKKAPTAKENTKASQSPIKTAQEQRDREIGGALFVDCKIGSMPIKSETGRISALSLFPLPKENGGGGLGEYWAGRSGEFNWTNLGVIWAYSCQVTNYFNRPLTSILVPIHLRFYESITRDSRTKEGGKITLERDWPVIITKIDEGAEKPFVFYVWNMSDNFAEFIIPDKATFQFVGETTRRVAFIQTDQNQPRFLSPIEKTSNLSAPSTMP